MHRPTSTTARTFTHQSITTVVTADSPTTLTVQQQSGRRASRRSLPAPTRRSSSSPSTSPRRPARRRRSSRRLPTRATRSPIAGVTSGLIAAGAAAGVVAVAGTGRNRRRGRWPAPTWHSLYRITTAAAMAALLLLLLRSGRRSWRVVRRPVVGDGTRKLIGRNTAAGAWTRKR